MAGGFYLDNGNPGTLGGALSAANNVSASLAKPDVQSVPRPAETENAALPGHVNQYERDTVAPPIWDTIKAALHENSLVRSLDDEKYNVYGPKRHVVWERGAGQSDAEAAASLDESAKTFQGIPDEPGYDPAKDPRVMGMSRDEAMHAMNMRSPEQMATFMYRMDQEKMRQQVLAESGTTGFFASLAVGMTDVAFAPAFAPARGATALARVANMTANGFLASSMTATGAYSQSTTMTPYDVAGQIGMGSLLIGATGGLLSHDPLKVEAKRVAGYDAIDRAAKVGDNLKSQHDAIDPILSGKGTAGESSYIRNEAVTQGRAADDIMQSIRNDGRITDSEYAAVSQRLEHLPPEITDGSILRIFDKDMDKAAGAAGRYSIAEDWINVSIENARIASDGSPDGFAKAFTHEVFHRALNLTLEVERSKWLKVWRLDPTGVGESPAAVAVGRSFDDLAYKLSPNEAFANSGMKYLDDVVTGAYRPGSAKTGVYGYLDGMFLKAKQVIGMAPKESQREVANRFMDQFMQRIRRDGAMLPDGASREAIYNALETHGRDMAIGLLLDSSGAISGVSAESYIQATRQGRAEPNMRVSSVLQSANDFLDTERLLRPDSSIAPTGIGLEKWNWSPWHWAMGSQSETVRNLMERLVATPGLKLTKNMSMDAHGNAMTPQPMVRSVKTAIDVNWRPKLASGLQILREGWLEGRGADITNPNVSSLKLGARDLFDKATGQKPGMSFDEFKGEVARAMFSFDKHSDPHVNAAAAKLRPIFDDIGESAAKEGVFSWEQRRLLRELTNDLERELGLHRSESFGLTEDRVIKVTDHSPTPHALELDKQIKELKVEIARIDGGGWKTDAQVKGESWFPKLLDRQTILRDPETYKGIVRSYLKSIGVTGDELEKAVVAHFDKVTQRKGYIDFFDDPINAPRSAKAREWQMPAHMVMNYIDTDVERILHRYVSQMGAAIEMSRSFEGHLDMKPMMDKIKLDYDAALKEAGGEVSALERLNKQYVEDKKALLAVRDMIFGVHNIPSDPDALHTRAIRSIKVLNAATLLGGVVLSSLSDVARPVMTEGLSKTMRYGIDAFMMDKSLWKLQEAELHAAGIANELWTHTRAASFSNWNEIYYNGSKLERGIEKIGNVFSMASGLSQWTDFAKTVAGTVIGNRILDDCLLYAEGKLSPKAMEDLARGGIGEKQAKTIAKMVREHGDMVTKEGWLSDAIGDKPFDTYMASMREKGGSLLANADAWADAEARMAFRGALYEDVNRAVVTPHIADRPLWMSTELGGLLGQFKAFGMSSTQRILMAGLQDRDAKFWNGMAMMTAAGMFANATKDAIQRNENWFERKWQDKLIDGMDRAGLLGSFGDINNLLERATENKISFNALLGDNEPKHTSAVAKWGALGPTPQQIARGFAMVGDLGRGEFGDAGANFRRLMPLQGLFYLQPGIHALQGMSHMVDGPSYGVGVGHESLQPYESSLNQAVH